LPLSVVVDDFVALFVQLTAEDEEDLLIITGNINQTRKLPTTNTLQGQIIEGYVFRDSRQEIVVLYKPPAILQRRLA